MSKMYRVDLHSLTPAEREAAYEQIDSLAFMTEMIMDPTGLEAIEVFWTTEDDFPSSELIPPGCSCYQI